MDDSKYTVIDTGIIPKFLTNGNGSLSEIYQKKAKGTGIVGLNPCYNGMKME